MVSDLEKYTRTQL